MQRFSALTNGYSFVLDQTEQRLIQRPEGLSEREKERLLWWEGYCDGSFQPSKGMMGIGGVLLNPYGDVSEIFSEAKIMPGAENTGSSKAEFEAVLRLLHMAKNKGIKKLLIKMDNRGATQALNAAQIQRPSAMQMYLDQALELTKNFEQVVYQWIPRVKNRYADSLSRAQIPEIPSEHARKVAKAPPPSPKVSKESSMSVAHVESIARRHPGVLVIDKEYFLADSRGAKSKAIAKWSEVPAFKFHTEHGSIGFGVASGVETKSAFGRSAWLLCEERSSPALAELRLMIKMLNKAKRAGMSKIVLESTNQALCLIVSGLKEPPAHLRSAVLTFFSKAQEFSAIAVHHKANIPAWSQVLEEAPGQLSKGFHSFETGFNVSVQADIEIVHVPEHHLIVTRTQVQGKQMYSAKLVKNPEDAELLMARSFAKNMDYFKQLSITEVRTKMNSAPLVQALQQRALSIDLMRSDWMQVMRQMSGMNVEFEVLSEQKVHEVVFIAKQNIPKPFEQSTEKIHQWRKSLEHKGLNHMHHPMESVKRVRF